MITQIVLLGTAIFVLAIGIFLVSFKMQEIERDVRYTNIRIDTLRERMNDLRKQLNRLTTEIINQKHEEN